jgi:hypothetical protein
VTPTARKGAALCAQTREESGKNHKDMVLCTIVAALARCGRRLRACAVECIQDLASTLKGYWRDKMLGNVDTSYSDSDRVTRGATQTLRNTFLRDTPLFLRCFDVFG